MNIAFTYNVRHVEPDINNPAYLKEAEFDTPETISGITSAIESLGHRVFGVEADERAYEKLKSLRGSIDLVFNLAESVNGADREAQLPAMMEMLKIPYTGPTPLSYALGLHKAKAKEIMRHYGVPTPDWAVVSKLEELFYLNFQHLPAIVKPLREGSSKGIRASNLVCTKDELDSQVAQLLSFFNQEVLIEKNLDGREFTVAILGAPPRVLPIIEITFDNLPDGMPKFDHYEAKWIYENPNSARDPFVCPASVDINLESSIKNLSLRAFNALEMKDWARLDIRLDENGAPNVIEINCPPGIIPDPRENSRFPRAAQVGGLEFPRMIEVILKSACKRHGIRYEGGQKQTAARVRVERETANA